MKVLVLDKDPAMVVLVLTAILAPIPKMLRLGIKVVIRYKEGILM